MPSQPRQYLRRVKYRPAAHSIEPFAARMMALTVLFACLSCVPPDVFAQAPASRSAMISYAAQRGDTLYTVAQKYLQEIDDWRVIAHINRVPAPRQLKPGTMLRLPVALLRREPLAARVVATSGNATYAIGNAPPLPLVPGVSLSEGDSIATGKTGFATIEFDDGSHVSLAPETVVTLATLTRTLLGEASERRLELRGGEVESEVTHAKRPRDRFEIRAAPIVAGVRGTHFRVNGGAQTSAVEVLDGTVAVAAAAAPATSSQRDDTLGAPSAGAQLVPAGFGSLTRAGRAVGTPVALLPAPELVHPGRIQDGAEVDFELVALQRARQYRVEIARDAGMLDRLKETRIEARGEAPHASLGELPDGNYFVRVSAIDDTGLEGMARVYALERRHMQLAASATRLPGSREYTFRWFASRTGVPTRYRFILSRDEDMREPLVDEVDISTDHIVVAGLRAGVYYWTVVAEQFENGQFYETASRVRSFTLAK